MHYAEMQDEGQDVLWHCRFENTREGLESMLQKMGKIEENNSDLIKGTFMNPTENYHVPVKYFLEKKGFHVYMVDARRTAHLRKIMNLGRRNPIPRMHMSLQQCHGLT